MSKADDSRAAKRATRVPERSVRAETPAAPAAEKAASVMPTFSASERTIDLSHLQSDARNLIVDAEARKQVAQPRHVRHWTIAAEYQGTPAAWLEASDNSLTPHTDTGDGRRIIIAWAVYDICDTLDGVPVFRFIHQAP